MTLDVDQKKTPILSSSPGAPLSVIMSLLAVSYTAVVAKEPGTPTSTRPAQLLVRRNTAAQDPHPFDVDVEETRLVRAIV